MNLLDIYRSKGGSLKELGIHEVLKTNCVSCKYGLLLTLSDANEIIEARNQAIKNHGRVELGIDTVKKIITAFCMSSYINPEYYVSTLNELIDTFYYMKNETEDIIPDDELINLMQEFFNNSCRGSVDLLKNRELTLFARNLRSDIDKSDFYEKEDDFDI
jgi:hypothetical protein